jgi:glycosyltransferase involved in cell wall biosynthesis
MASIAVIVANRNNGRFIEQCLESVFSQTLTPEEVIVVDDASSDDSLSILQKYSRKGRIRLILNDKPAGVAASRHRAACESNSRFLTTLDADDYYYDRSKLEAELRTLSEARGRLAFSDVMRVTEEGKTIGRVSAWRSIRQGNIEFDIRHLWGFIPRDYLVAREDYFAVGGFNPTLHLYEDWELKIRLSSRCTWHYSGVVGTAYRDNSRGLSKAPRAEHIRAMRNIFWMHCKARNPLTRAASFARFFLYHSLYLRRPAI